MAKSTAAELARQHGLTFLKSLARLNEDELESMYLARCLLRGMQVEEDRTMKLAVITRLAEYEAKRGS